MKEDEEVAVHLIPESAIVFVASTVVALEVVVVIVATVSVLVSVLVLI